MTEQQYYIKRCIELANAGAGFVAPNPMVGAVLVYDGRIIGEGFHRQYGQPHAEVNCIDAVAKKDQQFIPFSVLYVSLEPCAHQGKTPPCADFIIDQKIPEVVIGCRDSFKDVNGKGIEKLEAAGIKVTVGVLEDECIALNKRFFAFHRKQRPFVVLKWAQTANKKIAVHGKERLLITNEITNRLVHRWRSEEAAILVATNTALLDNPSLDNRLWFGKSPLRLVIDKHLRLPTSLKIFNGLQTTIVFNMIKHTMPKDAIAINQVTGIYYFQLNHIESVIQQIMRACYALQIQSVLVEGGAALLQSFINEGIWDEARMITNEELQVFEGLSAPQLSHATPAGKQHLIQDRIDYFTNSES